LARPTLLPSTTLFRSAADDAAAGPDAVSGADAAEGDAMPDVGRDYLWPDVVTMLPRADAASGLSIKINFQCSMNTGMCGMNQPRSEEHTSELQSLRHL